MSNTGINTAITLLRFNPIPIVGPLPIAVNDGSIREVRRLAPGLFHVEWMQPTDPSRRVLAFFFETTILMGIMSTWLSDSVLQITTIDPMVGGADPIAIHLRLDNGERGT